MGDAVLAVGAICRKWVFGGVDVFLALLVSLGMVRVDVELGRQAPAGLLRDELHW